MISVLLSRAVAAIPGRIGSLATGTRSQALRLVRNWRHRADIRKLQAMSDRQLSDIGLSRSRIEVAVRGETRTDAAPTRRLTSSLRS